MDQVLLSCMHRVNSRTAPAVPLCSPRLGVVGLRGFVAVWAGGVSLASMAPCPKNGPPGGPLFGAARRPQNNQGKRRTSTVLVHLLPWGFWARPAAPKSGPNSGSISGLRVCPSLCVVLRRAGGWVGGSGDFWRNRHGKPQAFRCRRRGRSLSCGRGSVHCRGSSIHRVVLRTPGLSGVRPDRQKQTQGHKRTHSFTPSPTCLACWFLLWFWLSRCLATHLRLFPWVRAFRLVACVPAAAWKFQELWLQSLRVAIGREKVHSLRQKTRRQA